MEFFTASAPLVAQQRSQNGDRVIVAIPWQVSVGGLFDRVRRGSDALKRKYEQRWPGPLASMLRDGVLSTTMRLEPA